MRFVDVVIMALGAAIVVGTLGSAVRTVIVPRGEQVWLSRIHFVVIRAFFEIGAKPIKDHDRRDAFMARYGPLALILLPLMWVIHVVAGFSLMFWALDTRPLQDSLVLSGSSLSTLGFRSTDDLPSLTLSIMEGLLGLGIVALMISFLPTIYSVFAQREAAVALLEVRAGRPPSPVTMLSRSSTIGLFDSFDETWGEWERWFIDIEETHTSFPALVFFRSAYPGRSWLTSAGCVLDTAALFQSTVNLRSSPHASLCLRAGFIALREVADYFGLPFDEAPAPDDPISIAREEYDEVCDKLEAAGLDLVEDRDQAWRDFAGWRVNYDAALLGLCHLVGAPEALWSGDRSGATSLRDLTRLLQRR